MDDIDLLACRFEEHRAHLRAVALRMLGSAGEAEDAVQETWLRFEASATSPRSVRADITCERHEINGQPGAIFRDREGRVLHTLVLDVLDGRIQAIRGVINPDKLGHLGVVADAWAVNREVRGV
jgi:hypothetical protein